MFPEPDTRARVAYAAGLTSAFPGGRWIGPRLEDGPWNVVCLDLSDHHQDDLVLAALDAYGSVEVRVADHTELYPAHLMLVPAFVADLLVWLAGRGEGATVYHTHPRSFPDEATARASAAEVASHCLHDLVGTLEQDEVDEMVAHLGAVDVMRQLREQFGDRVVRAAEARDYLSALLAATLVAVPTRD